MVSIASLYPSRRLIRRMVKGEIILEDTKHDSQGKETFEVLHHASECHHNTPCSGKDTKVMRWALELLKQDVTRDFEYEVRDEDCCSSRKVSIIASAKLGHVKHKHAQTARTVLYCTPVMFNSSTIPSILALPIFARSMWHIRYKSANMGTSRISI